MSTWKNKEQNSQYGVPQTHGCICICIWTYICVVDGVHQSCLSGCGPNSNVNVPSVMIWSDLISRVRMGSWWSSNNYYFNRALMRCSWAASRPPGGLWVGRRRPAWAGFSNHSLRNREKAPFFQVCVCFKPQKKLGPSKKKKKVKEWRSRVACMVEPCRKKKKKKHGLMARGEMNRLRSVWREGPCHP